MSKIILFDGECHFCNWNVRFIVKRDPKAIFRFASQQSEIGKELLKKYHIPKNVNSLVLIENNRFYTKSTAALRISKKLRFLWKCVYIFILVPRPIRDFIYQVIAANRYKWFGKEEACPIPSPEIKKRFL